MNELSGISNEKQIQHFKFSGLSFSDNVFNSLVEAWSEVCEEEFKSLLQNLKKETKQRLLSLPFRQKQLDKTFSQITRYCVTEVFAIPLGVTLPPHRKMQNGLAMITNGKSKHANEIDKEFKENMDLILKKRIELEKNEEKIGEIRECIKIWKEMEKVQETLIRSRMPTTEISSISSPV